MQALLIGQDGMECNVCNKVIPWNQLEGHYKADHPELIVRDHALRSDGVSERVSQKSQRLIAEGKVSRVKGHVYKVEGDSATYTVIVGYPQEVSGSCDCPSETKCSHLIAACAYDLEVPQEPRPATDPFRGLL